VKNSAQEKSAEAGGFLEIMLVLKTHNVFRHANVVLCRLQNLSHPRALKIVFHNTIKLTVTVFVLKFVWLGI
jgi:hypothetical protein